MTTARLASAVTALMLLIPHHGLAREASPVPPGNFVTLRISSQDPESAAMLHALDDALPDNASVSIHLEWLGAVGKSEAFHTRHGQTELAGDAVLACAAVLAPSPKALLTFAGCVVDTPQDVPRNFKQCIKDGAWPPEDVLRTEACYQSKVGGKLVEESLKRGGELNAPSTPTLQINHTRYAGAWNASAIRYALCHAELLPPSMPACQESLATPPPTLIVLDAPHATSAHLNTAHRARRIATRFHPLAVEIIPPGDPRWMTWFKGHETFPLPLFLLPQSVTSRPSNRTLPFALLPSEAKGYDVVQFPVEAPSTSAPAAARFPDDSVILYVSPHSLEGRKALKTLSLLQPIFGDVVSFHITWIVTKRGGQWTSPHGPQDLAEIQRGLCARRQGVEKERLYSTCRGAEPIQSNPDACITAANIDPELLVGCMAEWSTEVGNKTLEEESARAKPIRVLPTWVVKGKVLPGATDPRSVQDALCPLLTSPHSGCNKPLSGKDHRLDACW